MKQKNKLVAWQLWVSFKGKNVIATSRFANLSFQLEKIITRIVARFKQQYDPILTDVEESAQKEMNITSCEYGHNLQYHHLWSYQDISLVIILSSALIELKAQVWEEHIDKERLLPQIQLAGKARGDNFFEGSKIGGSPCAGKVFGKTRRGTLVALYQGVLWLGVSFCCLYRRWHPGGVGGGLVVT